MRHYLQQTWHNKTIMNIFAVIVSLFLFVSSFLLFAYAFAVPEEFAAIVFFTGIMSAALSVAIPFSILGHRER